MNVMSLFGQPAHDEVQYEAQIGKLRHPRLVGVRTDPGGMRTSVESSENSE
jgi:hypothetical protein